MQIRKILIFTVFFYILFVSFSLSDSNIYAQANSCGCWSEEQIGFDCCPCFCDVCPDWSGGPLNCSSEAPDEPTPEPTAGPPPPTFEYVPCYEREIPEFHSMRPYRASPCNTGLHDLALYCANDMLLREDFELEPSESDECDPNIHDPAILAILISNYHSGIINQITMQCRHDVERGSVENDIPGVQISVDLTNSELPFMGNTQLVPNQVNDGTPSPVNLNYAQRMNFYISWYLNGIPYRAEEEPADVIDDIDEPPLDVNDGAELLTTFGGPIKKLMPHEIQILRRQSVSDNLGADPGHQHDQIVRCGTRDNPGPCTPPGLITRLSETDGTDVYVPFSSMEDRLGTFELSLEHTIQPSSNEENDMEFTVGPDYVYEEEIFPNAYGFPNVDENTDLLYFSHMLESNDLEDYLQSTYMPHPSDINENISTGIYNTPGENYYNTNRCDLENARWNSGDDLLGEANPNQTPAGDVRYSGHFVCDYSVESACFDQCLAGGGSALECIDQCVSTCEKSSVVAVSAYVRTPLANENWSRLVASDQSFFNRFMPRIVPFDDGTDSIVAELLDLPGVTTANYSSSTAGVEVYAGNLDRSGNRANVFIPHLGGINEYFQIGLQNALRPQFFHTSYQAQEYVPPGEIVTGSCAPLTSGVCSVDNLTGYFGQYAENASQICNAESGGNSMALNPSCLNGGSYDFSVGLYQINLAPIVQRDGGVPVGLRSRCDVAGFSGAFITDVNNPNIHPNNPNVCGIIDDGTDCSMYDTVSGPYTGPCNSALRACLDHYSDVETNINFAVNLSAGGSDFSTHWGAAATCNIP